MYSVIAGPGSGSVILPHDGKADGQNTYKQACEKKLL
jgi:hypothetical protein